MNRTLSDDALIFAPNGRDARLAASILKESGIGSQITASLADMARQIQAGVGFAVVAEEAIEGADLQPVISTLDRQEEWSDLPFILLTRHGGGLERNPDAARHLNTLRNVTFLERPFHPTTFVSLARAALRSRWRQYEARARLIEIREREIELRDALAAGELGQWTLHIENMRLDASEACKAIFGREATADLGWDEILAAIHEDDRRAVDAVIARSSRHGDIGDVTFRFSRRDGDVRWVQAKGRPIFGPGGQVIKATGVVRDVTEQREADEKLRESERQFRTLADTIPTLCWVAHADGSIYWYNQRWYEYTGTTEADMVGWGWQSVHHPDVLPDVVTRWKQAVATGEPIEMVFPLRSAEGEYSPFLTRVVPVKNADGEVVGWFGTNTDISTQLEAEKSLRNLAAELEARVEERTRERAEAMAQLHEAQKIETIGQLTGGVAHDFNNLLTPVIGALDLLSRRHPDERSQRLINGALEASERSRTLISRLLAFARRQKLEAQPVDIGALVSGMVDLIARSLGPQIKIDLVIDEDVPLALVDPNQLELALLNLAVNARDAMTEGGTLTLSVRQSGEEFVSLTVADNGQGMDEETLARAIEPFYSTKETGKGTGLGLSMVHGLAAQSGGELRLTSTPGSGTTAELLLPITLNGTTEGHAIGATAVELPSLNVLLIDDNDLVRETTKEILQSLGHQVFEGRSAAEGLAVLRSESIDFVVSDYLMPEVSGAQFLREVAELEPDLPTLLISGYAESAEDLAGFPLLPKPFTPDELEQALFRAFMSRGMLRHLPAT